MTETATNEHPILFSGEMVRAILDGRKTQTRRVIRPQPKCVEYLHIGGGVDWPCVPTADGCMMAMHCPYGAPGDRLWVQEIYHHDWEHGRYFYQADADTDGTVPYLVSGIGGSGGGVGSANIPESEWMPADAMDRHQSRITLEVKRVWVERVQEIRQGDIEAEGMRISDGPVCDAYADAKDDFRRLWDSINASKGYDWDTNPRVWCVEFERVEDGR